MIDIDAPCAYGWCFIWNADGRRGFSLIPFSFLPLPPVKGDFNYMLLPLAVKENQRKIFPAR
jgi:hypothetical protein